MVAPHEPTDPMIAEARKLYERDIRAQVEPEHNGQLIVIDLDTGGFEVDADDMVAFERASQRFPGGRLFALRVGRRVAYRIGAAHPATKP